MDDDRQSADAAGVVAAVLMAPVLIPVGCAFLAYGYAARGAVRLYRFARRWPMPERPIRTDELAGFTNDDIDWLLSRDTTRRRT